MSPNIVRLVKSRGLQRAGHEVRMGETRSAYRILVGNLLENGYFENREEDGTTSRSY
jgi:hypothetical protein